MTSPIQDPYHLMRQNILSTASESFSSSPFEPTYLFAWQAGVYPFLDDTAPMHEPFNNQFNVTEEKILELYHFLQEIYLKCETITFWQLEDLFETHRLEDWDRPRLIDACRYLYLHNQFDDNFWQSLLQLISGTSDLRAITLPFNKNDLMI